MNRKELYKLVDKVLQKPPLDGKLSPDFVKALISVESSWDVDAQSPYARGLMQVSKLALKDVNDRYRLGYTWDDMLDPEKNILVGSIYFKWLLDYWKAKTPFNPFYIIFAVMSYNFGIGQVRDWIYHTKADNRYIDEAIPKETVAHAFDFMWWFTYFRNRNGDTK